MGANIGKRTHVTIEMQQATSSHEAHRVMAQEHMPYHNPTWNDRFQQDQPNVLNVERWREYMMNEIGNADRTLVTIPAEVNTMIRPVPQSLFEVKPSSYTPWVLHMGPLSPMLAQPSPIDRCKALCVNRFMARHNILTMDALMESLIPDPHILTNIYPDLLTSIYPHLLKHKLDNLRLLVAVDTAFLYEFLLFNDHLRADHYLYGFFNSEIRSNEICRDLLLMGNQIPMSLLKRIALEIQPKTVDHIAEFWNVVFRYVLHTNLFYGSQKGVDIKDSRTLSAWAIPTILESAHLLDCVYRSITKKLQTSCTKRPEASKSQHPKSYKKCVKKCVKQWILTPSEKLLKHVQMHLNTSQKKTTAASQETTTPPEIEYEQEPRPDARNITSYKECLTAICRLPAKLYELVSAPKTPGHTQQSYYFPTASRLSKAGIRFKACDGNVSSIKYHKRKLQLDLPRLMVTDSTEDRLRNLLAYEQTSTNGGELCRYAFTMDSLVDTAEDVAILTRAEVLVNHTGSNERLVNMWNDMCINIALRTSKEWEEMKQDVLEHCGSRWRRWHVEFHYTYFSRPWYWVPIFVAFLLLGFTALQTMYSILGFYGPSIHP